MKAHALSMQLCRNCGHAMHHHADERNACGFCQASPQMPCSCQQFQFPSTGKARKLPQEEQLKLACAALLSVHPGLIREIKEVYTEGGRLLIGLNVIIYIFTGDELQKWISDHIPTDEDWVLQYIAHLEQQKN